MQTEVAGGHRRPSSDETVAPSDLLVTTWAPSASSPAHVAEARTNAAIQPGDGVNTYVSDERSTATRTCLSRQHAGQITRGTRIAAIAATNPITSLGTIARWTDAEFLRRMGLSALRERSARSVGQLAERRAPRVARLPRCARPPPSPTVSSPPNGCVRRTPTHAGLAGPIIPPFGSVFDGPADRGLSSTR